MPNQYVNKVVYGSDTIIDISDTTAVASDVASGKYFYAATGEKTLGTASGGSVLIVDTEDSHGGTIRDITTGVETVTLQSAKTVDPSTSQQTVYPDTGYDGFSSITVNAMPPTLTQYLHGSVNADLIDETFSSAVPAYFCFRYNGGIKNVRLPNATSVGKSAFYISNITGTFFAPKASLGTEALYGSGITTGVSGAANSIGNSRPYGKYADANNNLETVDLTFKSSYGLSGQMFNGRSKLTLLILREEAIYPMYGTSAFDGTPFANGGAGGTIYIPKSLYDHLGDGSSSDYKAATNWSTIDGYGTITWAKIEGSIYETQYADGTLISV